jgi:hypothetical protein
MRQEPVKNAARIGWRIFAAVADENFSLHAQAGIPSL